jgi:hypothetical protein
MIGHKQIRKGRRAIAVCMDRVEQGLESLRYLTTGLAHGDVAVDRMLIRRSIELGVRYLKARQRKDGSWRGFLLHPGAATSWLTAHVAFVVENIPALAPECRRAAMFLARSGANDGGWGYNRRVAVDCDSTAQAIIVLHRFALRIESFLLKALVSAQLPSGGFPTYPSNGEAAGGWNREHPEVSAVVLLALRRCGVFEVNADRCERWLRSQTHHGLIKSYWWTGEHYGLWVQSRTGLLTSEANDAVRRAFLRTQATPQLAMALNASLVLSMRCEAWLGGVRLIRCQLTDGSWPCSACLRVTNPLHVSPGLDAPGPVARDETRILSTAHALGALQLMLAKHALA